MYSRVPEVVTSVLVLLVGACSSSSPEHASNQSDGGAPPVEGGEAGASGEGGPSSTTPTGLDIPTDKGIVHGSTAGGVRSFLGIPFGATTGGANRWKGPQPVAAWTTPLDATKLGPICPQINPQTMAYDPTGDEDCLSLNVWTPDPAPASPLPVMVWIFGGAYEFGSGGAMPYGGAQLVPKGNVVLVTLNYRVGALGFLANTALAGEGSGSAGNYGILDQRAALQWVQTNIANFGGDKSSVTLFGESAGGNSTCIHLVSPGSQGLFQRAIVESGLCTKPAETLAGAETIGDSYGTSLGCSGSGALACLRALTPQAAIMGPSPAPTMLPGGLFYQDDSKGGFFQPVVDGQILPDQPEALLAAKKVTVPVLHGANTAEGVLFHSGVFGDMPVMTTSDYQAALTRRFGSSAGAVAAQYPVAAFSSPNDALTQVTADAFFVCPARKTARLLEAGGTKSYHYTFNGTLTGTPLPALAGKAFHSSELPYVFGASYVLGSVDPSNQPLVDAIEGYWTRFAHTADPNGGSDPTWPVYTTAADQSMKLDTTIAVTTGVEKANCDFWDTVTIIAP